MFGAYLAHYQQLGCLKFKTIRSGFGPSGGTHNRLIQQHVDQGRIRMESTSAPSMSPTPSERMAT